MPIATIGAAERPISAWIGGYIGLSLSLAFCWIVLVWMGRVYRRHRATAPLSQPRMKTAFGQYFWHRREGFSRDLGRLGSWLDLDTARQEKEPASHRTP